MLLCVVICLLFTASLARSDIYMYRDENGVLHFTNVPTSPDYRLFIRHNPNRRLSPTTPNIYDTLIKDAAHEHGIAFELIKAIIKVESDFNPRAVSRSGAKGLMQIMPINYSSLGITDPFDPKQNISAGTRYFRQLLNRYEGQLSLSLAAYNAGPTTVDRYKRIPPYRETIDYVDKVLDYYNTFTK